MAEETYKLNYHNIRGLAEPIRLIFTYAQVKFEDNRIESAKWQALKQASPWGQLPTLEIGNKGIVIAQSLAIARYLARTFNLVGANDLESAKCDELVDALKDLQSAILPAFRESDETKKYELKAKVAKEVIPKFFEKITGILEKNGGEFLVGKSITWADLYYYNTISQCDTFLDGEDILEDAPVIAKYLDGIFKIPQIKSYIAKRPFSLA